MQQLIWEFLAAVFLSVAVSYAAGARDQLKQCGDTGLMSLPQTKALAEAISNSPHPDTKCPKADGIKLFGASERPMF